MNLQAAIPLLDDILASHRGELAGDFEAYRNHVYRMVHFCFALHPATPDERDKILIAAAFHDLGIWPSGTLDYLPPSIDRARAYLAGRGLEAWSDEIAAMIDMHHKLRPHTDDRWPLVEVFRRGDLVDFSLGLVRCGLPPELVRQVREAFPNAGFHRRLVELTGGWLRRHPVSLPPIFKW